MNYVKSRTRLFNVFGVQYKKNSIKSNINPNKLMPLPPSDLQYIGLDCKLADILKLDLFDTSEVGGTVKSLVKAFHFRTCKHTCTNTCKTTE